MGESAHRRVTVLRWGGQGTLPGRTKGLRYAVLLPALGEPRWETGPACAPAALRLLGLHPGDAPPAFPVQAAAFPLPASPGDAQHCAAVRCSSPGNITELSLGKDRQKKTTKTPSQFPNVIFTAHSCATCDCPERWPGDGPVPGTCCCATKLGKNKAAFNGGGCYGNVCLLRAKQKNRNAFRWSRCFTTRGVEGCCTAGSGLQWGPSAPHLAPPAVVLLLDLVLVSR